MLSLAKLCISKYFLFVLDSWHRFLKIVYHEIILLRLRNSREEGIKVCNIYKLEKPHFNHNNFIYIFNIIQITIIINFYMLV